MDQGKSVAIAELQGIIPNIAFLFNSKALHELKMFFD